MNRYINYILLSTLIVLPFKSIQSATLNELDKRVTKLEKQFNTVISKVDKINTKVNKVSDTVMKKQLPTISQESTASTAPEGEDLEEETTVSIADETEEE